MITLKKKSVFPKYWEKQIKVDCIGSHPTLKAAHRNFCVLYEACDLNMFSSCIHFIAFSCRRNLLQNPHFY